MEKEAPKLWKTLHSLLNSCVYPNSARRPSSCILKLTSEVDMILMRRGCSVETWSVSNAHSVHEVRYVVEARTYSGLSLSILCSHTPSSLFSQHYYQCCTHAACRAGGWTREESKGHEEVQESTTSSTEIVASESSQTGKIEFIRGRPSVTIYRTRLPFPCTSPETPHEARCCTGMLVLGGSQDSKVERVDCKVGLVCKPKCSIV